MRSASSRAVAALSVLLVAGAALAEKKKEKPREPEEPVAGEVSVRQGRGAGRLVLLGEAGWPGISAGALQGVAPNLDLGGRLTFNYGMEGNPRVIVPGVKAQFLLRAHLLDVDRLALGLELSPGVLAYFWPVNPYIGLQVPVGLVLGIAVSDQLKAHVAAEVPLTFYFSPRVSVDYAVLFGGGLEYWLDRQLAITLRIRIGPYVAAQGPGPQLSFHSLLGIAYAL